MTSVLRLATIHPDFSSFKIMDSSNKSDKPDSRDEGDVRSNVIYAADLFRKPQRTPPPRLQVVSASSSSNTAAPSEMDKYPNLHRNEGLMNRICRVYTQHLGQIRNGTDVTTRLKLRNDDPLVLCREVREFIGELDRDDGLIFSFSDTIPVEGGRWRLLDESPMPKQQVQLDELRKIRKRLEKEIDINLALRQESDEDTEDDAIVYRMRREDSGRIVESDAMGTVVNEEKTFAMKLITFLNTSRTRAGSKSLIHYISNVLSIQIAISRNK